MFSFGLLTTHNHIYNLNLISYAKHEYILVPHISRSSATHSKMQKMLLSTIAIFRNVDISGLYPRHDTREADAERRTMQ